METNVEKGSRHKDEDLTDIVGGSGPWQRTIFIFFLLAAAPNAWHNLVMAFMAPNLKHACAIPDEYINLTSRQEFQNTGSFFESTKESLNKCYTYEFQNFSVGDLVDSTEIPLLNITSNLTNARSFVNKTVPCQKWVYDDSEYTKTVVSQWDLVCTKEWMVSFTKTVFMAGFLVSLLILGPVADRIGRKPVLMASLAVFMVAAVICAFSISFTMFAVCRFFIAFGIAGMFNTAFVHLMEVISPESRSFYGIAIQFGWSIGYVLLPAVAWMIRDWNWLQLAITIPCVGLFTMGWYVPESPRWLITQGKLDKAQKILQKAAKVNGKNEQDVENALKRILIKNQKVSDDKVRNANICDLFKTSGLWQRTVCMCFTWFVASFIYYGLTYNTNDLAGDPFVNFAIAGAVEFPAYVVTIFVIKTLGRRRPLMVTLVAGGLSCLLTLPLTGDWAWIRMPLAMFGKFCITASFGIVFVYAAEIFPTVMRNTGVSSCSMCARIGSMLAPFVKELGQATHPAVPLSCFGVLSIISGLLVLFLPETNGCKVPDTVEEAAELGRRKKKKKQKISEMEDTHKMCIIHDGSNDVIEKSKKSASPSLKAVSDGKKLPDLLEEPSVVDEVTDDDQDNPPNVALSIEIDDLANFQSIESSCQEDVDLKPPDCSDKAESVVNPDPSGDNSQQTPL